LRFFYVPTTAAKSFLGLVELRDVGRAPPRISDTFLI